MKEAVLVLPNQLFRNFPGLSRDRPVVLAELSVFFVDPEHGIRFPRSKLILHRAAMRAYARNLEKQGFPVLHLEYRPGRDPAAVVERVAAEGIESLHLVDPVDHRLERDLVRSASARGVKLIRHDSPGFLTPEPWFRDFFAGAEHYSQTRFYTAQRRRLGILLDGDRPKGGKWTFDTENRRRLPAGLSPPRPTPPRENPFIPAARRWVKEVFSAHPGEGEEFIYPVTAADSLAWLDEFLETRLSRFGDYQDALGGEGGFLFHSGLTPMLNIGLLTPAEIVERTLDFAADHPVPLNSLEGFIRQIIGWREFMRAVYRLAGERQRAADFWNHDRPLPAAFYTGATGLEPFDGVVLRLLRTGYAHHIERLMVLGNLMLLCGIAPREVYRWFMELFIDGYDWVMVPNVFGMSQFADGGLITTKPYISASRYLRTMGDFPRGRWEAVWDGLFWRFIHRHVEVFAANPRMRVLAGALRRMDAARLKRHRDTAEAFLAGLADGEEKFSERGERRRK